MPEIATRADGVRLTSGSSEVIHLADLGVIPGVIITAVAGLCQSGVARLRCIDGLGVQFKAPGSSGWGAAVSPSLDGEYLLEDGSNADCWCRAYIYLDDLQAGTEAEVTLTNIYDNAVVDDDVTAAEAASGATLDHAVAIKNDSGAAIHKLTVWIEAGGGIDYISPLGSSWVNPTDEDSGLAYGDLAAGSSTPLHIRRVIGAAASADPKVTGALRASWYQ